jgi:hypothetical protein
MDVVNREEVIWAAGFFDGEGCISFYRDKRENTPRLSISVGQKRLEPLNRFDSVFFNWGRISTQSRSRVSYWQCYRFDRIQQISILMWPFLCKPKQEQIVIAINGYVNAWRKYPWKRIVYHVNEETFWRKVS